MFRVINIQVMFDYFREFALDCNARTQGTDIGLRVKGNSGN